MNTGLSQSDLEIIKATLHSFHNIDSAILFGSRAKGTYKKGSDVDIAIKLTSKSHKDSIQLIHDKLEEETPLPYFFDVIDITTIQNKDLLEHINRVGIPL